MVKKSQASIPWAWVCRNCRQVGLVCRGAGSTWAARGIVQTVLAPI